MFCFLNGGPRRTWPFVLFCSLLLFFFINYAYVCRWIRRNWKEQLSWVLSHDPVYWENTIYELKRSISYTYRHLGVFIQRFDIYVPWSFSRLGRTTKALIDLHNNLPQFADQEHYTKLIGKTFAGGSICLQLNTVTPECCRRLNIKHIKYIKPLFEQ